MWLQASWLGELGPGSRPKSRDTGGNLTTEVQSAAHAVEYHGEVVSNDTDLGRFDGIRWVNPLDAPASGS